MTRLSAAVAALRAAGDVDDGELADATRLRLRRSLEGRAKAHRQLASVIAIVATLLVGGAVSWALSTVHIPFLSSRVEAPAPERAREVPPHTERPRGMQPPVVPPAPPIAPPIPSAPVPPIPSAPVRPIPSPPVPAIPSAPVRPIPSAPVPAIPSAPVPPIPPAPVPPIPSAPTPAMPSAPVPAMPSAPPVAPATPSSPPASASHTPATPAVAAQVAVVEALYRKAHELHFHGTDYAAALAAWDAYLATEPGGRFVIEARFNRAIVLVKLARFAEARVALMPFARGEVTPAGYRREEAERLIRRLGTVTDAASPPQ